MIDLRDVIFNIDTGMGLERIAMVCQGVASTFETDLLKPILDKVSEMSGVAYKKSEKTDDGIKRTGKVIHIVSKKSTESTEQEDSITK